MIIVVLCVLRSVAAGLRTALKEGKLINQYAILGTHDSATGELKSERDKILAKWSRTQNGGILEQIECGARALDYRPFLADNGKLLAHHGPTVIYKEMEETLRELLHWGKENPTELVLLQVSHCVEERVHNNYYADSCYESTVSLLAKYHIPVLTSDDCSVLDTLTMEAALAKSGVWALFGCSTGYWDPSLTCTSRDYVCYDSWPTNTSSVPWDRLTSSLTQWSSYVPVSDGMLWGFGANWQSSAESVVMGTLHNSSLLLDEERSGLNAWTAQAIKDGKFTYLNMLSVDNVCHGGQEIFEALQEYNAQN